MSSIEAQLQGALIELRRVNGTKDVLVKQLDSAETLIAHVQEMMGLLQNELVGEARKPAVLMEKLCQDWRVKQSRITL